ncbi:MAG: MipA/OmpV family protein [Kiritimatiellae bacterium]|nr:MipA/OmpV family protein [Kiritimatiellia bacterium]
MMLLKSAFVAHAAELIVRLEYPPATGTVAFAFFDSANAFGDLRDPVKVLTRPLDRRSQYLLEELPPGEYALLVYHDENSNRRIDKTFIGIPKEPLGFSNRYRPKGPPSYSRAVFTLEEGRPRHFDIKLYRPLGKRGRVGAGMGVILRSTPYRDYDDGVYRVIPSITYIGNRLQVYGPNLQVGLIGSGKLRLAATGKYRIGAYDDDASSFLVDMGDRKDTFMAGLMIQTEWPGGVDFSMSYEHDVIDSIGGGMTRFGIDKSFQVGMFTFSPQLALNWLSAELSMHDFGVPVDKQTLQRQAYDIDDTVSVEAGVQLFIEITRNWLMVASFGFEFLDDKVVDSPIVEDDHVMKGFTAISYLF